MEEMRQEPRELWGPSAPVHVWQVGRELRAGRDALAPTQFSLSLFPTLPSFKGRRLGEKHGKEPHG